MIVPLLLLVGARGTFDPLPLVLPRYKWQPSALQYVNLIHGNPYYEVYFSWQEIIDKSDDDQIRAWLRSSADKTSAWFKTVQSLDRRRALRGDDASGYRIEYAVPG